MGDLEIWVCMKVKTTECGSPRVGGCLGRGRWEQSLLGGMHGVWNAKGKWVCPPVSAPTASEGMQGVRLEGGR